MTSATPPEATIEAFTRHGGDLDAAARLFPNAPRPWIDLSTGINPHPYALPPIAPEAWSRLPDLGALARLEALAARRYRAAARGVVVAAPGSQAIIQALARSLPAGRVGVLSPTYAGHARAWGAKAEPVERLERLVEYDVAIVVNPNNPDGRVLPAPVLLELADALAARAGVLIVDEAFADFDAAEHSLSPVLPERGAIVLRSFGKTHGLAGLRLGFAITGHEPAAAIRAALGPWSVSGPAIAVAAHALANEAWLLSARERLGAEADRLDLLLRGAGWEVLGGTRLFRLAKRGDAHARFLSLLSAGILTRPFAEASDRLRFGLPGDEAAWERLAAGLLG